MIGRDRLSFVPAQSDYEEEEDQDNSAGQYALDQEELDELQRDKENITKEVRSCGITTIPPARALLGWRLSLPSTCHHETSPYSSMNTNKIRQQVSKQLLHWFSTVKV